MRAWKYLFPKLAWAHPTIFLAMCGVVFHHLWMGIQQLVDGREERWPAEEGETYKIVYDLMPHLAWSLLSFLAVVLIIAGTFGNWHITQFGLGVGIILSVLRLVALEYGPAPGSALGVWSLVIVMHIVQIMQPPMNSTLSRESQ